MRARRRSWAHPLLVLYAAPTEEGPSRSGFVVGRRIGNAVVRNRVKRRLREALRVRHAALTTTADLVWIARPSIAAADFGAIEAAVESLLRRSGLAGTGGRGAATGRKGTRAPSGAPPPKNAGPTALTT